jgi:hypothetical protein
MSMSRSMKKLLALVAATLFLAPATTMAGEGRVPPDLKGYALQQYLGKRKKSPSTPEQPAANVPVASPETVPAPVTIVPPLQSLPVSQPAVRAPEPR